MKQRKYSQWRFVLVLGMGALIAMVLCVQCVRTFLYIDSVLIPRQAEHEAQRDAGAVSGAARSAGIDDPRNLGPALQHAISSAEGRLLWLRVVDSQNKVLSEAGTPPLTPTIPPRWPYRGQRRGGLGSPIKAPNGNGLSILLPLRMPRPSHPSERHSDYIISLGISLKAVSSTFAELRENLIIGMLASIALLAALGVIAIRARHYLRGRYLENELQLARRVQNDLQPKPHSISAHVEFAASANSADHIGGDFYDIFELESGKIAIVVGDVSGKGVSAALLVSVLHGAIRSSTASQHEFACERINRMLCERTSSERFATLFWAVFDPMTRTLRYVNAGHAAPMLVRKDRNRVERLSDGGPILGFFPQARYSAGEIDVSDHDALILYTDGVTEPANEKGEEFGEERIIQTLSNAGDFTPAKLCEQITAEVNAFSGAERSTADDRTLVVVGFLSSETSRQQDELLTALAGA